MSPTASGWATQIVADTGVREPDGERAADGAGAEDRDRRAHACAGSVTMFTTLRSE